ncbi:hypothetical protein NK8_19210 [Caballeronia sp. NK8]|uniref:hypothetical protein n=1 Tax=Caballeronia sp. NK8 TaxID=140098 RepID=UPI001BB67886|nr:hypothetical protein [Caballeronia sp. NK8]BCQ23778.1 hypothetical protein NK8_19210 [Caballeronia sp. NK8]
MVKLSKIKACVLDEFELRSDEWTFVTFEKALEEAMGFRYGNYQTAKSTISVAHDLGRWPKTVKRYVLTNRKSFGTTPGELHDALNDLYQHLTDEEKLEYNIEQ